MWLWGKLYGEKKKKSPEKHGSCCTAPPCPCPCSRTFLMSLGWQTFSFYFLTLDAALIVISFCGTTKQRGCVRVRSPRHWFMKHLNGCVPGRRRQKGSQLNKACLGPGSRRRRRRRSEGRWGARRRRKWEASWLTFISYALLFLPQMKFVGEDKSASGGRAPHVQK